jgi:DNA-binding transcriptional MerR regulator
VELSVEELADAAGVPVRTVRYYVTEGLIPGPGGRGRAAAYGDEHLLRLRLVRRLAEQRVPLAEIRARVVGLSLHDVAELMAEEDRRSVRVEAERASPKAYVSALLDRARSLNARPASPARPAPSSPAPPAPMSTLMRARRHEVAGADQWTRHELAPGVELHVRADAADAQRRLVRRLIDTASQELPNEEVT